MKIWVTRDEPVDGPLSTALRAEHLEVVHEPVLERHVLPDVLEVLAQLGPEDWLVLTSPYAIEALACDAATIPRVAVVAESSRQLAQRLGMRVEFVSAGGDGKSLFAELRGTVRSGTVCYPRSSKAAAQEPWPGITLLSPVLYETSLREYDRAVLEVAHVAAVASPSAVEAIGAVMLPFASIGPTTSAAIRKIGLEPWVEAPQPSFEALAKAIAAQDAESRHHRA